MLTITVGDDDLSVEVGERVMRLPVGVAVLERGLRSDPPLPEELTNAIGTVTDHLEDILREMPTIFDQEVAARGALVGVIADVEAGVHRPLPHEVARDDLEELFRTLATEPAGDRRHNPGLPPADVERIVPVCCILVAVARRLHLDHLMLT
jgi:exopolyphosphatase / guanosine-5'-triphosphate,3'-diphosphate pyrophosphatase